MRDQLIQWQWGSYATFHQRPLTLWLHLVAVPAFVSSTLALVASLLALSLWGLMVALAGMALGFGVQGFTHKRERNPSIPFSGAADAVTRILLEQFFTFPRFVVTGGWWRALQQSRRASP